VGCTEELLSDVRRQIAPSDERLTLVRQHRDEVVAVAARFDGVLRTYVSGSVAHGTANDDLDADCGVVLDRRSYPKFGPDGDSEGPGAIVESVRSFLGDELRLTHPNAYLRLTKRSIKVSFREPMEDGFDPTVDLIVALTRKAGALWIPNLEQGHWNASDPEYHTMLLTAEPKSLRVTRARAIRLAKAWNASFSKPGLCSFNIAALALSAVEEGVGVPRALLALFDFGARDLDEHLTADPAGLSGPIKLLIETGSVVERMRRAADLMRQALEHDKDEDAVADALANLFPKYVKPPVGSSSKAGLASALRQGNSAVGVRLGSLAVAAPRQVHLKETRAYGGAGQESR